MITDGYLKIKYRLLLSAAWLCLIFCSHACIITDQAILHNPALQINTVPVHNFSFSEPEQGVRISLRPLKTLSQQSDEKEETRRNTGDEISAVNPESLSETDSGKTVVNPEIRFKPTPKLPSLPIEMQAVPKPKPTKFSDAPLTVNLDGMPLPAFINEVYGNILKISFEVDSALRNKADLVTLRTESPISPSDMDALARQVLNNYGVSAERQGEVLRFVMGKGSASGEPPLLISGRTLPEVPMSHRPVFQLVPLEAVRNVHVAGWLKQAYKGQEMEVFEDPERNAVLLMGVPSVVEQAVEAVRVLDQPYMRGRHSVRIEPVFLNADEMSSLLIEVLNSEGYSASQRPPMGSIIVLPVKAVNAVLVFAAEASVLEHIKEWANMLDHPSQETRGKDGFFYYQVRNTRAEEMSKMLDKVLEGLITESAPQKDKPPSSKSPKLVVDDVRNGLIFQGNTDSWERLLPVIREMDRPARMVLIEVTVAEVTLTDQDEFGIEWLFKNVRTGGVLNSLNIGAKGLTYILDNAGQTRAMINAFAATSRVSILSTPRVMVKSGGKATIDVGTEVPIITSQSTASDLQPSSGSSILQEVQYRKTGTLLNVSPVVHSGNRVDLEITQEVSKSQPNETSNISSPSIYTRKISTSLGLKDGGSVLLGGLISSSSNQGYSGIPVLSDIPILGRLFRVEKENKDRTELIMLIAPYVIDNHEDAEAVTESFKKQLHEMQGDKEKKEDKEKT